MEFHVVTPRSQVIDDPVAEAQGPGVQAENPQPTGPLPFAGHI